MKCCSSIKQVKNWGSAILYTYVNNSTSRGGGGCYSLHDPYFEVHRRSKLYFVKILLIDQV